MINEEDEKNEDFEIYDNLNTRVKMLEELYEELINNLINY